MIFYKRKKNVWWWRRRRRSKGMKKEREKWNHFNLLSSQIAIECCCCFFCNYKVKSERFARLKIKWTAKSLFFSFCIFSFCVKCIKMLAVKHCEWSDDVLIVFQIVINRFVWMSVILNLLQSFSYKEWFQ